MKSQRVVSGYNAKLGGHKMETLVARELGPSYRISNDNGRKTDILCNEGGIRISLKNPTGRHTQVALISQNTFASLLGDSLPIRSFIKLFFGFADGRPLNKEKLTPFGVEWNLLSNEQEVYRNRLKFANVPAELQSLFMDSLQFETTSRRLIKSIVVGDSTTMGWLLKKDDPSSVLYATMTDIEAFLARGVWSASASQTTLELRVDGVRQMHLQMKGSSERYGAGYHSCMFHLYDGFLCGVPTSKLPVK